MESLTSGTLAGTGSFRCEECGYVVTLAAADALPACPGCGGRELRARLAVRGRALPADAPPRRRPPRSATTWLDAARERDRRARPVPRLRGRRRRPHRGRSTREWTRIGRSLAADVRFDDPTVSRRHALIVRQADGVRVLDDRSLNGVFVNGERVEWRDAARRRRDRRRPLPPALPRGHGRSPSPAAERRFEAAR